MPSQGEGITLDILDKLEVLTESKALEFFTEKAIFAILGTNPMGWLVILLTPIIKLAFKNTVKPLLELLYLNLHAGVAIQSGKWTIRKLDKLTEEGDDDEVWNTIHTNY